MCVVCVRTGVVFGQQKTFCFFHERICAGCCGRLLKQNSTPCGYNIGLTLHMPLYFFVVRGGSNEEVVLVS